MAAEESLSKLLYKTELLSLKIIPMLIAGVYLLNTTLSYFYIDLPILSTIGGMSLLPLIFLYISSYTFKFCAYHRMFLHYIVANDAISYIDYVTDGSVFSERTYLITHIIILGVCLYLILYLRKYELDCKDGNKAAARNCK